MNSTQKPIPFTLTLVSFLLGMLCFIGRMILEGLNPITPEQFKGLIYVRDICFLLPAFIFLSFGLQKLINKEYRFHINLRLPFPPNSLGPYFLVFIISTLVFRAVSFWVLNDSAHIEDEALYIHMAKVLQSGALRIKTPNLPPEMFEMRYLIQDPQGWFSVFFLGHSSLLSLGLSLGLLSWINPVLGGILVTTTYHISSMLHGRSTGIVAVIFCLISPFFLFQCASFFGHIFPAILVTLIIYLFLSNRNESIPIYCLVGFMNGLLFPFRPLSALIVGLWCGILFLSKRTSFKVKLKGTFFYGLCVLPGCVLFLYLNFLYTQNPFITPYSSTMQDPALVFGINILKNSFINLLGLSVDLIGIPLLSIVPLSWYLLKRDIWYREITLLLFLWILLYNAHTYHGLSYGPRFLFEIAPLLIIMSAKTLVAFSENHLKPAILTNYLIFLVCFSFLGCFTTRSAVFTKRAIYYDIAALEKTITRFPALVIITDEEDQRLRPYLAGFQRNQAHLNGEIVYIKSTPSLEEYIHNHPDIWNYYEMNVGLKTLQPLKPE